MTDHHEALRRWARGQYPIEAAVELLIRHGRFAEPGYRWVDAHGGAHRIDWDVLAAYAAGSSYSGSERRVLGLAASIAGAEVPGFTSADYISGLEYSTVQLALAAVSHASGVHERQDVWEVFARAEAEDRSPTTDEIHAARRPGPLVAWPPP